jgi:hypothetical protein
MEHVLDAPQENECLQYDSRFAAKISVAGGKSPLLTKEGVGGGLSRFVDNFEQTES